jgi:hypothetical protein
MGFARFPPLCRSSVRVSTPGSQGFHRPGPARNRDPVPSSWSLTTSTACSTRGLRVCCTPLTTLGFDAFPAQTPGGHPRVHRRVLRLSRAANRTLRRVPLISSRTASLRPLPSCLCYTPFASGLCGVAAALAVWPKPRAGGLCPPRPKPGLTQCACAGRSRCWRGVLAQAEAVASTECACAGRSRCQHGVCLRGPEPLLTRCACAGRSRCWRVGCLWPRPQAARSRFSRECREPSRPSGSRSCRPNPGGFGAHPSRPEPRGWHSPTTEVADEVEEPVPCPGEAPIRRGGPPRHQTGLRACRRAGRPRSHGTGTATRRWWPGRCGGDPAAQCGR